LKVIIDTNVIISGIFFGGKPDVILKAWKNGKIIITIDQEILREYYSTAEKLEAIS
jgi:predicted nucleic acid-binding protein